MDLVNGLVNGMDLMEEWMDKGRMDYPRQVTPTSAPSRTRVAPVGLRAGWWCASGKKTLYSSEMSPNVEASKP